LFAISFSAAIFALAGCVQHMEIEPGSTGKSSFCLKLIQGLPVEIANQLLRSTKPTDTGTAAWGDPAIVLRCGVLKPQSMTATSRIISINSIDWFQEPLTEGNRFTSVNTSEYIEINIPNSYEPASSILVDLANALPNN
jgi:hypothetical protein